ncbi:hypothetical protein [Hydrogenophaga sp. PAMC20947]|uniref:hypothetical protein n=1 Tax=Hydrogenophaga sp. PAMC20947 TaxID=2565558 RepID=UPI001FF97006|nr:hypothetical protein [Hydrogenophaga sp. PAMC20947]
MSERCFVWQVPLAHPAFAGHFPGRPILPGVVLLDQAILFAQAQVNATVGVDEGHGGMDSWTVSQTKFLSPVAPGESLTFTLTPDLRGGCKFAIHASDARAVATGSLAPRKA